MTRTTPALLALLPAFAFGYLACTGEPATEDQETIVEEESAIVAPDQTLIGTFRNQEIRLGSLVLLVLKSDGTYHSGTPVACIAAPCPPVAEDGQYTIWRRDGGTYMSLYPEDQRAPTRYQYAHVGDSLRMKRLGDGQWISLQRTQNASWCEEPKDCSLQNLPVGPCASQWRCESDLCRYSCRPILPTE